MPVSVPGVIMAKSATAQNTLRVVMCAYTVANVDKPDRLHIMRLRGLLNGDASSERDSGGPSELLRCCQP